MLRLNEKALVMLSVGGQVTSAVWPAQRQYRLGADGVSRVLPGTGGICYSHQIGDLACELWGDHVEPGVTIKAANADDNSALNTLSCVGNEARVVSGDAKGARGVVTGTHGGVNHLMVDFAQGVLDKLCIGDRIQVRAYGVGLSLLDIPEVSVMSADPALVRAWKLKIERGKLVVPVTHLVPAAIMGSGLGATTCYAGDYDIQMFDAESVRKYKLENLRFGDLVAIIDADHTYGRRYLGGAISVGVIVHSRSDMSGHGPGVATLLTSPTGKISPKLSPEANIGKLLRIGRWRKRR
jgi:hypothetical protein